MSTYFIINVCVANIYGEYNFGSPVVTQGLLGESCSVLNETEKWIRIKQSDNYEGWINKFYGVISDAPYDSNRSCSDLGGFIYTDVHSKIPIREITFGARLSSTKSDKGWSVTLPDGKKGWTEITLRKNAIDLNREAAVNLAKQFLGIQYLWGGKSPKGFDCSGLIQTIFNSMEVVLPRDSEDQSRYFINHKINREKALPGDLHFFGTEKSVTHVAMEIGHRQYLHCQGWVKEESFDKNQPNYNKKLEASYLHTVSVGKCLDQSH